MEFWKNVAHLKLDNLLLVLPELMLYNSHATFMAKDMCILYKDTAHSHFRADQEQSTWDLNLG